MVANNGFWNGDRLLDLIGVLLAVCALTTVGRTFQPVCQGKTLTAGAVLGERRVRL
jgi:hypothetical protein